MSLARDLQQETKFLDVNYLIGTIQCLALATIDLHPRGAFLTLLFIDKVYSLVKLSFRKKGFLGFRL
uniref:Uncharacterized protein n=1 Tax=Uncultured archaeon GZfos26G2 TaxID=3386331 RepID=Q64A75_UNCAG|nr:hypothetical protein GZ32G12_17 [uncultured archaeon GZfos32G12]